VAWTLGTPRFSRRQRRPKPRCRAADAADGARAHAQDDDKPQPAHPFNPATVKTRNPQTKQSQAWQTIPGLAAVVICLTAGGFIREGVAHVYWGKPRPGALDPFTKALLARDVGVLEERRQAAEAAEQAAAK
jgi:hypothetical protein